MFYRTHTHIYIIDNIGACVESGDMRQGWQRQIEVCR